MLHLGLILSKQREYAQAMRQGLMTVGDSQTRVDVEVDPMRAMQLAAQHYELILLDSEIAAIDGLQLLLLIKQHAPTTRFVIVTDSSDEAMRALAYQNGADLVILRPRTPEALTAALGAISGLLRPSRDDEPFEGEGGDGPVVGIADIVQMRCLSGDSVLLRVRSVSQRGEIEIFRGEVYSAHYPGQSGEQAFVDMVGWDEGLVRIKALRLAHVPSRRIETPYRALLDRVRKVPAPSADGKPPTGEMRPVSETAALPDTAALSVILEAPPREEPAPVAPAESVIISPSPSGTPLPQTNSHWRISLSGELMEGSKVSEPDRAAFITSFIYRKLADVAVALEVDYFTHLTLLGPHQQQVLVADNLGVRHAVFDTLWTSEETRIQYVKWCCEQSI